MARKRQRSGVGIVASKKTKSQFSDELSRYTQLTKDEVNDLFPKKTDRDQLIALLKIVDSASKENEKKALISENIHELSGTVIKLAKNFFPSI